MLYLKVESLYICAAGAAGLALCQVLPPSTIAIEDDSCTTNTNRPHTDGVPSVILRCIGCKKGKRCDNPITVAKTNHPCSTNSSLCVALKVHNVPANNDRSARKHAHCDKTDTCILHSQVIMECHEDCEAGDGQYQSEDDEWLAKLCAIGEISCDDAESKGSC